MKRSIKMVLAGVMAATAAVVGVVVARPALAALCPKGSKNETYKTSLAECNIESTTGNDSLMNRVQILIDIALGLVGVIAVVVIILGGIQYATSQGDPGKVKKAKDTILYGVIGLVVALLAYAIVNFVISGLFNGGNSSVDYSSYTTESTCTDAGGKWAGGACSEK